MKQYDPDNSCCYSFQEGEDDMIRLIKEEKYEQIRDFVFSPNYFYAINAMEASLYLAHAGKISLDDQWKERINDLKSKDFKIGIRHTAPDVYSQEDGYSSLHTSDEAVIKKYQYSLQ